MELGLSAIPEATRYRRAARQPTVYPACFIEVSFGIYRLRFYLTPLASIKRLGTGCYRKFAAEAGILSQLKSARWERWCRNPGKAHEA